MTYLFQGLIFSDNIVISDILFNSNNKNIALWYLIRLYYKQNKNDNYEKFIFKKIKSIIDNTDIPNHIIKSYTKFILYHNDIISLLLFVMSNDIINLSILFDWTLQYNLLNPNNKIIIKQRLVFNVNDRNFSQDINLNDDNFKSFDSKQCYFLDNQHDKLILNHNSFNNSKQFTSLVLHNHNRPYSNDKSIIDEYKYWNFNSRFKKYTINSLLLDDKKFPLKIKK